MAYTKTTWVAGDAITAAKLNNLETQYDQILTSTGVIPTTSLATDAITQVIDVESTTSFSTSSATYVDVTGLSATITISAGSKLLVLLAGGPIAHTATVANIAFLVNGTDYLVQQLQSTVGVNAASAARVFTGLGAGTYTIKVRASRTVSGQVQIPSATTGVIRLTLIELKK